MRYRFPNAMPNAKRRGRKTQENMFSEITIRRPIREDMWVYELIASSSNQTPDFIGEDSNHSNYYFEAKWLLQQLYPHCLQNWERFLKSQGCTFEDPSLPSFEKPYNDYVNPQYFQPNENEVQESKNLLLLSTVAGIKQRCGCSGTRSRQCVSNGFHHDEGISSRRNDGTGGNCIGDESCPDSPSMLAFAQTVVIKSEDESSTYLNI